MVEALSPFGLILGLVMLLPGIIIGSAFAELARPQPAATRSLRQAILLAFDRTRHIRVRLPRSSRTSSSDDEWGQLILLVLGGVVLLGLYVRHVVEVGFALFLLCALVFLATSIAFLVFWRNRCVDGASVGWRLLFGVILLTTGLFNALWIQQPPLHGDAITAAREAVATGGLFGVVGLSSTHQVQVVMQLIGAGFTVAMALVLIGLCLASTTAVFIMVGNRPGTLWRGLFWLNRRTVGIGMWSTAAGVGLVSMVFTSGIAYDWIDALGSAVRQAMMNAR